MLRSRPARIIYAFRIAWIIGSIALGAAALGWFVDAAATLIINARAAYSEFPAPTTPPRGGYGGRDTPVPAPTMRGDAR